MQKPLGKVTSCFYYNFMVEGARTPKNEINGNFLEVIRARSSRGKNFISELGNRICKGTKFQVNSVSISNILLSWRYFRIAKIKRSRLSLVPFLYSSLLIYVKKPVIPRAFHEDEWPVGVWGSEPQAYEAFSKEEAPFCGRGSSLKQVRVLTQVFNFVI